jgi:hypothetical protein
MVGSRSQTLALNYGDLIPNKVNAYFGCHSISANIQSRDTLALIYKNLLIEFASIKVHDTGYMAKTMIAEPFITRCSAVILDFSSDIGN